MSLSICKVCKEPIWNFLCLDCLAEDVKKWLPSSYLTGFRSFHKTFVRHFITPQDATFDSCLKCKNLWEAEVCAFCYINEFISWMKHVDAPLVEKMSKSFIFSFERKGEFDGFFQNTRLQPVTHIRCERQSFGICDSCGEYSDELMPAGDGWVCLDCREHGE